MGAGGPAGRGQGSAHPKKRDLSWAAALGAKKTPGTEEEELFDFRAGKALEDQSTPDLRDGETGPARRRTCSRSPGTSEAEQVAKPGPVAPTRPGCLGPAPRHLSPGAGKCRDRVQQNSPTLEPSSSRQTRSAKTLLPSPSWHLVPGSGSRQPLRQGTEAGQRPNQADMSMGCRLG